MGRRAKLILGLFATGAVLLFLPRSKEEFSCRTVQSSLKPKAEWENPPPPSHIRSILSQQFTYLGEGQQAIAFLSQDGKHVLKLFKMRRFEPSFIDQLCPHVVQRRHRNLNWVFNGYMNAYKDLRQETGLVWVHLTKTQDLKEQLHLIDKNSRVHLLDADEYEFVIQEKAELIFDRFSRLQSEGKQEELERSMALLFDLIEQRRDKGYADRDKAVSNNFGFVGDRPIQIDIGRLYKGTKEGQLEHIKRRVARWQAEQTQELMDHP